MKSPELFTISLGGIIGLIMALLDKYIFGGSNVFSPLEYILMGLVAGGLVVLASKKK